MLNVLSSDSRSVRLPSDTNDSRPIRYTYDDDDTNKVGRWNGAPKEQLDFNDKSVRAAFIRKVFALDLIMFGIVAAMTSIPFFYKPAMVFLQAKKNRGYFYVSIGVFIAVYAPIFFIRSLRRRFPWNLVVAAVLTVAVGYFVMALSAISGLEIALISLVATFISCSITIAFAAQTKYDLTKKNGLAIFIVIMLVVSAGVAALCAFALKVRPLYSVGAAIGAFVFMIILAVDVQWIIGGKRFELSPEEYTFAAIQLFVDIIFVFILIMIILLLAGGGGGGLGRGGGGSSGGGGGGGGGGSGGRRGGGCCCCFGSEEEEDV